MSNLSKTDEGIKWLSQFNVTDQVLACELLDAIKLIKHDEFVESIRQRIIDKTSDVKGMVALYAEREVRKGKYKIPNRLYKEPYTKKNRRAYGMGPQPVLPTRNYDLKVGSEGIIAWIVSELCTELPNRFICHPSPDQIRKNKIKRFILVTDIIGSGKRAREYLESAWRVASIKSWNSFKYLQFSVIAYTGTDVGIRNVKQHKTRPNVDIVKPCPTIETEFDDAKSNQMRLLCIKKDPVDHNSIDSLGYNGSEALVVFYHGCPNNLPRIFHEHTKGSWNPLFPKRRTSAIRHIFGEHENNNDLEKRLNRLRETRLAKGNWLPKMSREGINIILVLTVLRRGPRFIELIARKTGLTISEVEIIVGKLKEWNWITKSKYLTTSGHGQLAHARKITNTNVANKDKDKDKDYYFPKLLRAPRIASS